MPSRATWNGSGRSAWPDEAGLGSRAATSHPGLSAPYLEAAGGRAVKDCHINIFFSEEDGGYVADIPDLRACSAIGSSPEEALRELQVAKNAWLESAKAAGKPILPARYRPVADQQAS